MNNEEKMAVYGNWYLLLRTLCTQETSTLAGVYAPGLASTFRKTVPAASRLWPAVCGLPGDVRKRWTIRRFLWSPFLPSFQSFWIPRGRRNGSQKKRRRDDESRDERDNVLLPAAATFPVRPATTKINYCTFFFEYRRRLSSPPPPRPSAVTLSTARDTL